jgi:hypothetical protein
MENYELQVRGGFAASCNIESVVLSDEDQAKIDASLELINRILAPIGDPSKVQPIILKTFSCFNDYGMKAEDIAIKVATYSEELSEYPFWAIKTVTKQLRRRGHEGNSYPTLPDICGRIDALLSPVKSRMFYLNAVLEKTECLEK